MDATTEKPHVIRLLGEDDEVVAELEFSDEEFADIVAAGETTEGGIEAFVNHALAEGLSREASEKGNKT